MKPFPPTSTKVGKFPLNNETVSADTKVGKFPQNNETVSADIYKGKKVPESRRPFNYGSIGFRSTTLN
jgi:hypothetical protein